ncbi:hypothetical protein BJY52DRAFT_1192574 [Lactarius psammicola]|nr:hypothetical protein BJY52DRAFT_1192574 [Lactarius psammicola]
MLAQEPSLDSTRIAESQENLSQLLVEVTVLLAHNVPHIKKKFGLKTRFFVTVTSHAVIKKTKCVQIDGQTVHWNQRLGTFIVQPSSRLILCLYAERFAHRDILIGTLEMIPVESQTGVPFVLANGNRLARQSIQPVTLYLTVFVFPKETSYPVLPTYLRSTEANELPPIEATKPSMIQDSTNNTRFTIATGSGETLSPPTDRLPSEMSMSPAAGRRAEMSPARNALLGAGEAMATIDLSKTWEGALKRIKWVMDTVSSIAELHPYAKMAYGLLFAIPRTLLEQFQRDDNIRKLLVAMHDAFDFANQEDRFRTIERVPRQAQILTLMLQHVCDCCNFIQSYAEISPLWKQMLKITDSEVDNKIEDFRTKLLELHKSFLDEATVTTEITALKILDDVGIISANVGRISSQLDGMATQLRWVSNQVSDAELDAKIRDIPYGIGSQLPEKSKSTPPPVPARAVAPPLSLTVTPRELQPPTSDVAEVPLQALISICAFLASNIARAVQRAELRATPSLAGLEPCIDAVCRDLAYIDEVVAGKRAEAEEERNADDEAASTKVAVAEVPLLALSRVCAFLASNIACAEQRAELGATPSLAGLEPYLDSVLVDPAYTDEVAAEKCTEAEEEERSIDDEATAIKVTVAESYKDAQDAGASASALSRPSHAPCYFTSSGGAKGGRKGRARKKGGKKETVYDLDRWAAVLEEPAQRGKRALCHWPAWNVPIWMTLGGVRRETPGFRTPLARSRREQLVA